MADAIGELVEVVLFEDRAAVTRRFPVAPGRQRIRLGPLSPLLSDRRVSFPSGGLVIEDVRVERSTVTRREADPERIAALAADVLAAETDARAAQQALQRAKEREYRAHQLVETALAATGRMLVETTEGTGSWLDGVRGLVARFGEAKLATVEAERAVTDLEAEHQVRKRALQAARHGTSETRAWLVLDVVAGEEAATAEVSYVLPGAVWRPAHRAAFESDRLELVSRAICWNATGEDWETPRLVCSTARPGASAVPPALLDDVVSAKRRATEVVVEARDETVQVARERGSRASNHLPGVDDGGEPRIYRVDAPPGAPIALPSTGRPVGIDLDRFTSDAQLRWVAAPELSGAVVARVTARNLGSRPLLAGPVELRRADLHVGVTQITLVPAGEPFALGMGSADGVRVTRKRTDEHHVQMVTGRQTHTVKVEIRVSHAGDAPLAVRIEERVPVSDLKEVAIGAPKAHPALDAPPDRDGFVAWTLELAPGDHRTLTLTFVVDASSNVQLPF